MVLQRSCDSFDQERHGGQLDTARSVVILAGLADGFQLRDISIIKVDHPRNGRPGFVHLGCNGLPDLGHAIDPDRSVVIVSDGSR